ncbi:LytTR family DNA-binding domain-containing protein [uncultured Ferrimonas sp.]|uniref:LytR/AlgR family response regulator transcription factor n=1 Tax=uncultured Ferrimonas sp. TaxID=432640 RepID=UPI00260D3578|nr:LytTR family DNA-binding domain-containing protein [uncultured Ferrimonas sp.]
MLKVLIVDDEKLARMELRRLLTPLTDVEICAEASNGLQALECIQQHSVDLVLIDIKMPDMDGLEFAKKVGKSVNVVFCTAYSDHAVEAFELDAVDYIMKPVQAARLESVINKVRLLRSDDSAPVSYMPEQHGLMLKFGQEYQIVRVEQINHIESVGNHVALHTDAGKAYLHASLSKVEKKLNPEHFFKISRSDIVRISHIASIEDGVGAGTLLAHLHSAKQLEVSRRQAQSLRKLFSLDLY